MLGVGLWGRAKGNSHMGKDHRAGASVYFWTHLVFIYLFIYFFFHQNVCLGLILELVL